MPEKIYLTKEIDCEGEEYQYLDYQEKKDSKEITNPLDVKLETLTDFLDGKAESANYHEFVMCHRTLAVILIKQIGKDAATQIIWEIAQLGGLQNLSSKDLMREIGVPRGWGDFRFTD